MALLLLAHPEISEENFNWIQSFREKNDRHYPLFMPHFTLIFPVYDINENDFKEHVKQRAAGFSKIKFTLKSAITVKDSFSDFWDIFLVPDEGNGAIIKLHDELYKGVLITYLRIDLPYIPHMNIGNDIDPFYAIELANGINNSNISISGEINRLSIVSYDGEKAEIIEDITLL